MEKIAQRLRQRKEKIIFVCSSPYNMLVAVSLIIKADLYGKCGMILPTYSDKNIRYFNKIAEKLESVGVVCAVINKKSMLHRAIGLSNYENMAVFNRVLQRLQTKKNEYFLVNHTWNKALVCYPASLWFRYCKESIFVEEGCTQSATPDENPLILWLKRLYGNQSEFWKDNRIQEIYVQNKRLFADYPIHNMQEFKLQVTFDQIEKNEILDIFVNMQDRTEIERMTNQTVGIVFTQPFSEDGFIKEKEKIQIFQKLVKYYSKYGKVFLKIHPRDKSDYGLSDAVTLKGSYPSELFNLLGIKFRFAIGVCTSAVETVEADIRMNLNSNFLKEHRYELIPLNESKLTDCSGKYVKQEQR